MSLSDTTCTRSGSISVLLVDDSPDDAELTSRALRSSGVDPDHIIHVEDLASAFEAYQRGHFDVILLDLGLQTSWGLDTLHAVRKSITQTPIVVFSGLEDESTARASLENGAQDYLLKGQVTVEYLNRAVRYAIHRQQLVGELQEAKELLESKNERLAKLCNTAQQFVDNVSHEFRTPLTVIQEFASLMREGLAGPLTEKQSGFLDTVLNRVDDLSRMVDDMLDTSKIEAGLLSVQRKSTGLRPIAEHVWPALQRRATAKNISLQADIAEELPAVFCDDEKVGRILTNLGINAIKFTPDGGQVRIWARRCKDDACVEVGVTDSGPGISPQDRQKIFERFQQLEQGVHSSCKGFGLGLGIARELVALNFGEMKVESEPGKGSTFSFTLPVALPRVVLDKFLGFVEQRCGESATLSLVLAEFGTMRAREQTQLNNLLDSFVQGESRGHDLAYRLSPTRWVLATTCPPHELPRLKQRLEDAWGMYRRNCPRGDLPELKLECRSTFDRHAQRSALEHAWQDLTQDHPRPKENSFSVLVVDDDCEIQQVLRFRLENAGYRVILADNGEAGIEQALAAHPDAILMDVVMPCKDGLTALDELQKHEETRGTPVIMLSASVRDQQQSLERGARFFVPKPFDMNGVLEAIETSLHSVN